MNELIQLALSYAEHDLPVFPTQGKKPLIKDWPNLATTNEAQIREWFTKYEKDMHNLATAQETRRIACPIVAPHSELTRAIKTKW